MTAQPASLTCEEFEDLAGGVALDAADAEDVRLVEAHVRACPTCRESLDELRMVAAGLGGLVPQLEPPPALRERVFEAVRREPRPLAFVRRLMSRRSSASRRSVSLAWLVAAASLIVAIASLTWVAMLQGQMTDLRTAALAAGEREARIDRVVSVLASDKLAVKPLQPAATLPSSGYVFLDPDSGTGMLMCHDLPPVEQGHAYQIWFVRGNDRFSAGMLWPDRSGDGYTMIQVPPDVQTFDSIGLTDEPGNGSAWPTTPRVIGAPIRESTN